MEWSHIMPATSQLSETNRREGSLRFNSKNPRQPPRHFSYLKEMRIKTFSLARQSFGHIAVSTLFSAVPILMLCLVIIWQQGARERLRANIVNDQIKVIEDLNENVTVYIKSEHLPSGDALPLSKLANIGLNAGISLSNGRAWIAPNGAVCIISKVVPNPGEPYAVLTYFDRNRVRMWYPIMPKQNWSGWNGLGVSDILGISE